MINFGEKSNLIQGKKQIITWYTQDKEYKDAEKHAKAEGGVVLDTAKLEPHPSTFVKLLHNDNTVSL